ncbi:ACT domain-containing protein [Paraglaciecola aquimarina]|uniref:ACT domain-containing protein n=2 Tax=Paraglaciecola algarum TaxID=3050085 RepID=A0ABS9DCT9_9ALTE|nr:ACT domain-containing protein [Paraglaciecola sp. G1-23]
MSPSINNQAFVFTKIEKADYPKLEKLQPIGTFQEKEALTVIVTKQAAEQFHLPYESVFKCITLSVHSSLEAVGLTAAVASKLAEYNISANVVAAYYHDHIFVCETDAVQAMKALHELSQQGI